MERVKPCILYTRSTNPLSAHKVDGEIAWKAERSTADFEFRRGLTQANEVATEITGAHGRKTVLLFKGLPETREANAELSHILGDNHEITFHTLGYFIVSYTQGKIYQFNRMNELSEIVLFQINP